MGMEFLEQNKDDIIKLYSDGMFQRDIADMYNTSSASIGRLLRKYGFSRGKVTENDYDDIVNMYLSGVTVDDIVKKYRVSNKTIYDILKLKNVKLLDYGEHAKIYTLNEHYFDIIDTHNKAYILGLLYADGCNTEKCITLSLKSCDKHILESINNELSSNRPLKLLPYSQKSNNWSDQYELVITNKYMAMQLSRLGMVKNKSLILTFPEWIDDKFVSSFFRGYMDGDGTIGKYECRISFIGTEQFCEKAAEFLNKKLGVHCGVYKCNKNSLTSTRIMQIAGRNQAKKFLDYIYEDAELFLERKYEIYQNVYCSNENINNTLTA
jgi:uncharacterized protein (DUF433 family)